jgi:hypothetical protein
LYGISLAKIVPSIHGIFHGIPLKEFNGIPSEIQWKIPWKIL